jgi:pyruvate dehydrogenase E1 component alpha subunit
VFEAAREAIERARDGGGPSALELTCNRFHGHFIGDAQHYRHPDELTACREDDPLIRFRERVLAEQRLDPEELDRIAAETATEVDHAAEKARAAPPPQSAALTSDVYVAYA